MLSENYYLVTNEIGLKLVKCKDYSNKLFLYGGIIHLCIIESSTSIIYDIKCSIFTLSQYCSYAIIPYVAHKLERKLPIRGNNYKRKNQLFLKDGESSLTLFIKDEWGPLHEKTRERIRNFFKSP